LSGGEVESRHALLGSGMNVRARSGKNGDDLRIRISLRRRHQGRSVVLVEEVHVRTLREGGPHLLGRASSAQLQKRRVAHGTERSRDERQGQHQHSREQRHNVLPHAPFPPPNT